MSLPIVLREDARAEFDQAFDWYERQKPGLGVEFVAKVQDVFDRISNLPLLHAIVFEDVRRAPVKKFPYAVYYRPEPDQVVVIAVFHNRRDPSVLQSRN